MCQIHLSSIITIVVSKKVISPGLTLKKHQAMNIETFANKKNIISFLNCLVNKGTLRKKIKIMSIRSNTNKSNILGKINAIILRIKTIRIFVIG